MLKNLIPQKSVIYLINKYSDSLSRIEIESLLSHMFKCTRTDLYINNIIIDRRTENLCDSLVQRRLSGEPLQYITGHAEFMGLDFIVDRNVFIPRPETEVLVREVLLLASNLQALKNTNLKILDLCTGCGNIAVSLARLMPRLKIIATDISEFALNLARKNSILHGVERNMVFYKGDLFYALPFDKKYKFDIIVCNPPYIKGPELEFLQKEVRFEPSISLDGGINGLEFYARIARLAPDYLKPKSSLFLEIGFDQARHVKNIFGSGNFGILRVKKDFSNLDRVIWIDLL